MKAASLVLGILVICGMFLGLFPFFGWFNWFNLPVAFVGLILGIIGIISDTKGSNTNAIAGIILSFVALVVGFFRLIIGFGIF